MCCIDEELPFEVPENWSWCRLSNACIINPKNNADDDLPVSFVPMTLIKDGYSNQFISEQRKWKEVKKGFTHFAENDVGFAKITPCFENRKSVVFRNLCNEYGAGTTELYILRALPDTLLPEYLLYIVKSEMFISGGKQSFSGAVGQQRVDKEYVSNLINKLKIFDLVKKEPSKLSGGQKQKVCIARSLVNKPLILFFAPTLPSKATIASD